MPGVTVSLYVSETTLSEDWVDSTFTSVKQMGMGLMEWLSETKLGSVNSG